MNRKSTSEIIQRAIDNIVNNLTKSEAIILLKNLETDGWSEDNVALLDLTIAKLVEALEDE